MDFNYFEHIRNLLETNPEEAIESLERHEQNLKNNPIDLHFAYNQIIDVYYKHRNNEDMLNKCIEACKKDIDLYPIFKEAYIKHDINMLKQSRDIWDINSKDYDKYQKMIDDYKYNSPRIPSFQRLAIIYDRLGKFEKAIEVCELAMKYDLDDGTQGGFSGRIERLKRKISNPPTKRKPPSKEVSEKNQLMKDNINKIVKNNEVTKDGFMITFSKSTSSNFDRALFLAKQSDEFKLTEQNNQTIYQALFYPKNYLDFITLYELIGNWKSTFVFRNGEMLDRKTLGQINHCYGDKLRSHDNKFCYGASMFTENPFGCHRLMIHSGQRPWYQWKIGEDNRYIYIDKKAMKKQIDARAMTYNLCPAFNYEHIINVLEELPNKIDKKSNLYNNLYAKNPSTTLTINIDLEDVRSQKKKHISPVKLNKPHSSTGCGSVLLIFPLLVITFIFISKLIT